MSKVVMVYTTMPTWNESREMACILLKKKLIACVNCAPYESFYLNGDTIIEEKEIVMILKTSNNLFEDLENEIKKIHPYDTPFIAKIDVEVNASYVQWLLNQVSVK